jgi:putative transposase
MSEDRVQDALIKSWTVSDEWWARAEPLIPRKQCEKERQYQHKPGAGCKTMLKRRSFSAMVYALRTACQWKALPRRSVSTSLRQVRE